MGNRLKKGKSRDREHRGGLHRLGMKEYLTPIYRAASKT